MPFLTINGLDFHYIERGQEHARTTVMVHGLGDNLLVWYLVANSAPLSDQHVVAFDLRGHGKSGLSESGYDLATLSSDLEGIVAQLAHGSPINLVGNSLGSTIVLRFATAHPDKVARMVLVEPTLPPFNYDRDDPSNTVEEWMKRVPPGSREVFARHPIIMTRVLHKYLSLRDNTSVISDLLAEPLFQSEELQHLDIPTLVISGARSHWQESTDFIVRSIPGARNRTFETSHFLMLEASKEAAQAIGEFLRA